MFKIFLYNICLYCLPLQPFRHAISACCLPKKSATDFTLLHTKSVYGSSGVLLIWGQNVEVLLLLGFKKKKLGNKKTMDICSWILIVA